MHLMFNNALLTKAEGNLFVFVKRLLISVAAGTVVGLAGTAFALTLGWVNAFRADNPIVLFMLPVAGIIIVWIYSLGGEKTAGGTNMIIRSIRDEADPPLILSLFIFVSTALTHLCGGSAGREGAALQLGGSIGGGMGKLLRFDPLYQSEIVMCGMSAAFAALFGTPMTAAVFVLELSAVGIIHYGTMIPCALSAVTASMVSSFFGIEAEGFPLVGIDLTPTNIIRAVILGAMCSVVAIMFCAAIHNGEHLAARLVKNAYARAAVGGCAIILLTYILGTRDFLGAGMNVIERAVVSGEAGYFDFLIKTAFTAITIACGFKGGEIVPAFFVGASFGCVVGPLIGLEPRFAAALGLVCVFCAVTNCPLASIMLSFEMFSFMSPAIFMLAAGTSYALSGYYSLYSSQVFKFDKLSAAAVDEWGH